MALRRNSDSAGLRPVVAREYPRDDRGLTDQLYDPDPDVRRHAARDLGSRPGNDAALGNRLKVETDPSVREALFTALMTNPGDATVKILVEQLRSEDAGLRNGAIEALTGMSALVGKYIAGLLEDADSDVRIFTVNLLEDLPHVDVVPWLVKVLEKEPHVNVVAAAIEVLTELGGPTEVPVLKAVRERFHDDDFIRFIADLAIQRAGAA